ncbi:MAG: DUF1922 domain-containing protein [Methanobacteriaceae archaeon]|nr:DUF1922 domain-containing protein [Methanobacteriaceae archaeon]MDO9627894.1 DUF1922 domain-containing protein [Methanobacteriaceae archaeon]
MYLIFRCDCGRGMYAKEGVATRKCICGKTIKVKTRRIVKKVEDYQTASDEVRDLQEEKYGGTFFTTADKVK